MIQDYHKMIPFFEPEAMEALQQATKSYSLGLSEDAAFQTLDQPYGATLHDGAIQRAASLRQRYNGFFKHVGMSNTFNTSSHLLL